MRGAVILVFVLMLSTSFAYAFSFDSLNWVENINEKKTITGNFVLSVPKGGSGSSGGISTVCGDRRCDSGEDSVSCPGDCDLQVPVCNYNGICEQYTGEIEQHCVDCSGSGSGSGGGTCYNDLNLRGCLGGMTGCAKIPVNCNSNLCNSGPCTNGGGGGGGMACSRDIDCGQYICNDGFKTNRGSCLNGNCISILFAVNPCLYHGGEKTGGTTSGTGSGTGTTCSSAGQNCGGNVPNPKSCCAGLTCQASCTGNNCPTDGGGICVKSRETCSSCKSKNYNYICLTNTAPSKEVCTNADTGVLNCIDCWKDDYVSDPGACSQFAPNCASNLYLKCENGNWACRADCYYDSDCAVGKCANGKRYQQSTCSGGKCQQINYLLDPCLNNVSIEESIQPLKIKRVSSMSVDNFRGAVYIYLGEGDSYAASIGPTGLFNGGNEFNIEEKIVRLWVTGSTPEQIIRITNEKGTNLAYLPNGPAKVYVAEDGSTYWAEKNGVEIAEADAFEPSNLARAAPEDNGLRIKKIYGMSVNTSLEGTVVNADIVRDNGERIKQLAYISTSGTFTQRPGNAGLINDVEGLLGISLVPVTKNKNLSIMINTDKGNITVYAASKVGTYNYFYVDENGSTYYMYSGGKVLPVSEAMTPENLARAAGSYNEGYIEEHNCTPSKTPLLIKNVYGAMSVYSARISVQTPITPRSSAELQIINLGSVGNVQRKVFTPSLVVENQRYVAGTNAATSNNIEGNLIISLVRSNSTKYEGILQLLTDKGQINVILPPNKWSCGTCAEWFYVAEDGSTYYHGNNILPSEAFLEKNLAAAGCSLKEDYCPNDCPSKYTCSFDECILDCFDSDQSNDNIKGNLTNSSGAVLAYDSCVSSTIIKEPYCALDYYNNFRYIQKSCGNNRQCVNGACVGDEYPGDCYYDPCLPDPVTGLQCMAEPNEVSCNDPSCNLGACTSTVCNNLGDKRCYGNGYQICVNPPAPTGNNGIGSPLWGNVNSCGSGESCVNGNCTNALNGYCGDGICGNSFVGGLGGAPAQIENNKSCPIDCKQNANTIDCDLCLNEGKSYLCTFTQDNSKVCSDSMQGNANCVLCNQTSGGPVSCGGLANNEMICTGNMSYQKCTRVNGSPWILINSECVQGKICQNNECVNEPLRCFDSDGLNYTNKGNVTNSTGVSYDYCITGKALKEYYCSSSNRTTYSNRNCLSNQICEDGRCKEREVIINSIIPNPAGFGDKVIITGKGFTEDSYVDFEGMSSGTGDFKQDVYFVNETTIGFLYYNNTAMDLIGKNALKQFRLDGKNYPVKLTDVLSPIKAMISFGGVKKSVTKGLAYQFMKDIELFVKDIDYSNNNSLKIVELEIAPEISNNDNAAFNSGIYNLTIVTEGKRSNGKIFNLTFEYENENECFDSDGKNYTIMGTLIDGTGVSKIDSCIDNNLLKEFYCSNNIATDETVSCRQGETCRNGKCLNKTRQIGISSPKGGVKIAVDSKTTIKWVSTSDVNRVNIRFEPTSCENVYCMDSNDYIVKNLSGVKEYSWKAGKNMSGAIALPGLYKIKIEDYYDNEIYGTSGMFMIYCKKNTDCATGYKCQEGQCVVKTN